MVSAIPADASCLIHLARTDAYDEAARCVDALLATPAVWREAVEDAERFGYGEAVRIRSAEGVGIVRRTPLDAGGRTLAGALAGAHNLGQGESETIALGRQVGRAVLDDGRAARVAEALGVEPLSTLFLPVLGRLRGVPAFEAIALLRRLAVVMSARADAVIEIERHLEEMQ
jgi:hypothetical protein